MKLFKSKDMLARKQLASNTYAESFKIAIATFTSSIEYLTTINERIDASIEEIDEYKKGLDQTKESLEETREKNAGIIKNFSALLNIN